MRDLEFIGSLPQVVGLDPPGSNLAKRLSKLSTKRSSFGYRLVAGDCSRLKGTLQRSFH